MHYFSIHIYVLCFTEVRLAPHISSLYELPMYHMYTNARNVHGDGVAIYVSNEYNSSVLNQFTLSDSFIEFIGVEATVLTRKY